MALGPADPSPPRRPGSVRRTTTIEVTWPSGPAGELHLTGSGRDLYTPVAGDPTVRDTAEATLVVAADGTVAELRSTPERNWAELTGLRATSGFRTRLAERYPDRAADGSVLALLLDDTPAALLVCWFAYSRWTDIHAVMRSIGRQPRDFTGICAGFRPGSSGLAADGTSRWIQQTRVVSPLDPAEDRWAWHSRDEVGGEVSLRRARRLDVSRTGDDIEVHAFFQDSATTPRGDREAVHEYTVQARIGAEDRIRSLTASPRVLPYDECVSASSNVDTLAGTHLDELRRTVPVTLAGTVGCTHLNDVIRGLADARVLADMIET